MEEEVRKAVRERPERSIRFMEEWLEAQSRANAEEGTSRFDSDDATLSLLTPKGSGGNAMMLEPVQERDAFVDEGIEVEVPGTSGHQLITSFFQVRRVNGLV